MAARRNWKSTVGMVCLLASGALDLVEAVSANSIYFDDELPSYHYGAPIHVECMNRSS